MRGDHAPPRHPGPATRLVVSRLLPESPQALFVSYSSALGGAERILLDRAGALPSAVIACPPGALADAARERGLEVAGCSARRAELRGSARDRAGAPLRLAAQAAEVRAAVTRHRARLRGGLEHARAAVLGRRAVRRARRAAAGVRPQRPAALAGRRAGGARRRAPLRAPWWRCPRRSPTTSAWPDATVIHPGRGPAPVRRRPAPRRPAARAAAGRARGLEAARPGAGDRGPHRAPPLHVAGAPLDDAGHAAAGAACARAPTSPTCAAGSRSPATARTRPPRWPRPPACCTAPTASRSAWSWPRRWPAAGRWRRRPPPARWRSWTARCGSLYRPGDADAGAHALAEVIERAPELAAPARARAEERFDVQ